MNTGAYVLVVLGILIAKCLGFLRDIVFASTFGASQLTDIYFQVFGMASLIFTGIGGALSTLIIKNLNKPEYAIPEKQKKYVAGFITKTAYITLGVTVLLYLLAGPLVNLILPGLDDALHHQAVNIMYIMLPSCLFVIIAYIMSGVLQNCGVFFITSVMSLPYNVAIIGSLMFDDISITTVSIITTIGWFLHIVMLLPSFIRKGYSPFGKPSEFRFSRDNREIIYIFISSMMFQLVFMIDKAAVSADSGAVSTVNYASNLFVTISSVFVVAMSNVSYPSISRHFESGNTALVCKNLRYIITVLFAIFVPFILTVTCFGKDIISVLYQRGEFTKELSDTTATLFCIYTFGIFGYVCQELFNKVLYLDGKYVYTVVGTLAAIAIKPIVNTFIANGSAVAVALSTTVIFTLYALCIFFAISKAVGNYINKELILNISKIAAAGIAAFFVYFLFASVNLSLPGGRLSFVIPLALCGVMYVLILTLSGLLKFIVKRNEG